MSDKLIEIAKANGAWTWARLPEGGSHIRLTDDQLRATIEQVCAPLAEALESAGIAMDKGENILKTIQSLKKILDAHAAIMGDKE